MNFNIKLNALLWEICKLGSAAAACTSWNSVHSMVINRQQVIWESLGLVSGVTNSIWEKLHSLVDGWVWKNATAWSWKFLSEWIPSVPQAQGPGPTANTHLPLASFGLSCCQHFHALPVVTFARPKCWNSPCLGELLPQQVSVGLSVHERRLGSVPLQQETTWGSSVVWGGSGLVLVISPQTELCQHHCTCRGLRSLFGVSQEILCWDKWIRTTSNGQQ